MHKNNMKGYQGRLYRTTDPGKNRSWGPSFPFFCLKTRFFFKKNYKKSLFFLRRSSFVEAPSASDHWQPPGSPGGKDGPAHGLQHTKKISYPYNKKMNYYTFLFRRSLLLLAFVELEYERENQNHECQNQRRSRSPTTPTVY